MGFDPECLLGLGQMYRGAHFNSSSEMAIPLRTGGKLKDNNKQFKMTDSSEMIYGSRVQRGGYGTLICTYYHNANSHNPP